MNRARIVALVLALVALPSAFAEDRLILADGTELTGRFVSFDEERIVFAPEGGAEAAHALAEVSRVVVAPTPAVAEVLRLARAQADGGNPAAAASALQTAVDDGKDHAFLLRSALAAAFAAEKKWVEAWRALEGVPAPFRTPELAATEGEVRSVLLEARRKVLERARTSADKGDLDEALQHLERYLPEAVAGEVGEADPRQTLFAEMTRLLREWEARAVAAGGSEAVSACPKCTGDGAITCPQCDGSGTYKKILRARMDLSNGRYTPERSVDVDCDACDKRLKVACPDCKGAGIDIEALPSRERSSIVALVQAICAKSTGALGKETAREAIEKLATLSRNAVVPADLKVEYKDGKPLRDALGADPIRQPEWEAIRALETTWGTADELAKLDFLVGLAIEYAIARTRLDSFAASPETLAARGRGVPVGPIGSEELSARARLLDGKWVQVIGVHRGSATSTDHPFLEAFELEGDHAFLVVFYKAAGLDWMRGAVDLGITRETGLRQVADSYPRDLAGKIKALAPGEKVELEGRVQFNAGRAPIAVFEIWGVRSLGRAVAGRGEGEGSENGGAGTGQAGGTGEGGGTPGAGAGGTPGAGAGGTPGGVERREPPVRGEVPPHLAGRKPGDLAEEARRAFDRARKGFVQSGATRAILPDLAFARELFWAALALDPENRYLEDAIADVTEMEDRVRAGG